MAKRRSRPVIWLPSNCRAAWLAALTMPRSTIRAGSSIASSRVDARASELGMASTISRHRPNALGRCPPQPLMGAEGADREDQQDRIAPELKSRAIGPRQQILVDAFENTAKRSGQL